MNRPHRERRWQSPKDRARVAAELIEEAESLSATGLIATPADLKQASSPPPIHVEREARTVAPAPAVVAGVPVPDPAHSAPPPTNGTKHATEATERVPLLTNGDRELALAELDRALTAAPDDATCLLARAGLLATTGNYAAARQDLERLLRACPDHGEALTALGIVLSRRGLWSEAVAVLQRALSVDELRSTAWYYLGEALNRLDDLSGALAAFTRAAELEPAHAKSYYGQGIVLDRMNRPEDATRMYRRARDVTRR